MAKDSPLWIGVIVFLMGGLLWINYSNKVEYTKISDYRTITNPTSKVTCNNFKTQAEAQLFFETNTELKAGIALDGDRDGKVCETLP